MVARVSTILTYLSRGSMGGSTRSATGRPYGRSDSVRLLVVEVVLAG